MCVEKGKVRWMNGSARTRGSSSSFTSCRQRILFEEVANDVDEMASMRGESRDANEGAVDSAMRLYVATPTCT